MRVTFSTDSFGCFVSRTLRSSASTSAALSESTISLTVFPIISSSLSPNIRLEITVQESIASFMIFDSGEDGSVVYKGLKAFFAFE